MFKFLPLLAALPLAALPISTQALALDPNGICYMQTASGQIISLNRLCSGSAAPTRAVGSSVITSRRQTAAKGALVSQGQGGYYDKTDGSVVDYNYEIWLDQDNASYSLKVWESRNYPNGPAVRSVSHFSSSREALDYFDCYYNRKSLPSCPQ